MWPLRKKDRLIEDRETIRKLNQLTSPYSPDMGLLQEHQRILIFVFDDMMQGKTNADLIVATSVTGRWPLANAYTEDKFYFWKKDLGKMSYPVALEKPVSGFTRFDATPAKIWGELYAIRPTSFNLLDTERENGLQYTRRRVKVRVPYIYSKPIPEIREVILEPFMYIGNHEYWDDQLAGIHTSKPIDKTPDPREWLGAHYRFK
jgi:gamma-glutamylcyclotransferase (GGCT)/AIG2-like uncharacterized protein YtfP